MLRNYRYMETGVCALCGADVRLDDVEGRVMCDGCGRATDNCTCVVNDLDTRHSSTGRTRSMRKGSSATWIADTPESYSDTPVEEAVAEDSSAEGTDKEG